MDWKEILEWNDPQLQDLRYVGYSYIKQGCYEIAFDFFNALVIVDPENIYDLQTLGALYLKKEDFLKALEYTDKALTLNPNNYLALLNRTRALFSLGYTRQAIAQAKQLEKCENIKIANQASALVHSHS